MRNFNEIFWENVAYDIIKIHRKTGLHPRSRNLEKPQGGQIDKPSRPFRVKISQGINFSKLEWRNNSEYPPFHRLYWQLTSNKTIEPAGQGARRIILQILTSPGKYP